MEYTWEHYFESVAAHAFKITKLTTSEREAKVSAPSGSANPLSRVEQLVAISRPAMFEENMII